MPGYSTVTGENSSNVSMGAGTSLFRKLVSVGSGFTITGWDLTVSFGGEASAVATGLTTGVPSPDLQLKFGLSYGPSVFSPPSLLTNEDASSMLWFRSADDQSQLLVAPASTSWQSLLTFRISASSRYQFRLSAGSDFCFQAGNNGSGTLACQLVSTLRVTYA